MAPQAKALRTDGEFHEVLPWFQSKLLISESSGGDDARTSILNFHLHRRIGILALLRRILGTVVVLAFAGWLYSDDGIPKPDLAGAVESLRQTLVDLEKEIKDLRSSVKELATDAKAAQKRGVRVGEPQVLPQATTEAPVASPGPNWQRAQETFERGRRSEDLKSYAPAIEAFSETIELDPKNDSAFLHRGYAEYYLGDFASAVADLTESLALQPHNSRAYAMRASALASSGKAAMALADINQAIQRDARNPENYLLRANLREQLGQAWLALDDYAQVIEIAPNSERAYVRRAAILRGRGQLPESLADCYKAIQLNPADTAAYLCRAQFYLSTGAPQPALEDLNRAILIGQKPGEATALLSEARKMVDTVEQVPAPSPQAPQQAVVAQVLAPPSASPVPVPSSARAPVTPVRFAPSRPRVAAGLKTPQLAASLVLREGANKEAHDPRYAVRLYGEGRAWSELKNFEEAVEVFTQALQIDATFPLALNSRGYARLRLRRYEDAIADFNQAIRLNPAYVNAYRNRSAAKRALGDVAGARNDQRHAAELNRTAQATLSKPPSRP